MHRAIICVTLWWFRAEALRCLAGGKMPSMSKAVYNVVRRLRNQYTNWLEEQRMQQVQKAKESQKSKAFAHSCNCLQCFLLLINSGLGLPFGVLSLKDVESIIFALIIRSPDQHKIRACWPSAGKKSQLHQAWISSLPLLAQAKVFKTTHPGEAYRSAGRACTHFWGADVMGTGKTLHPTLVFWNLLNRTEKLTVPQRQIVEWKCPALAGRFSDGGCFQHLSWRGLPRTAEDSLDYQQKGCPFAVSLLNRSASLVQNQDASMPLV